MGTLDERIKRRNWQEEQQAMTPDWNPTPPHPREEAETICATLATYQGECPKRAIALLRALLGRVEKIEEELVKRRLLIYELAEHAQIVEAERDALRINAVKDYARIVQLENDALQAESERDALRKERDAALGQVQALAKALGIEKDQTAAALAQVAGLRGAAEKILQLSVFNGDIRAREIARSALASTEEKK